MGKAVDLHASLAFMANGLTILGYASVLLVNLKPSKTTALIFVVLVTGDSLFNLCCALFLSGIAAATREAWWYGSITDIPIKPKSPVGTEPDVLGRLSEAADVANGLKAVS